MLYLKARMESSVLKKSYIVKRLVKRVVNLVWIDACALGK